MPKVGKLKIQIDRTDYDYLLHYDDDRGFYAKDFPAHIAHFMRNYYSNDNSKPVNKADTKQELKDQLTGILKEYMMLTATKKQVIRLRVGMSTQLYLKQKDSDFGGKSWDGTNVYDQFKELNVHERNTSFEIHNKIPWPLGWIMRSATWWKLPVIKSSIG
jgi:hypothetical protein